MGTNKLHKILDTALYSRLVIVLWVISFITVCYLSLTPRIEFPLEFKWSDKLYHILFYLWLSLLPFFGFKGIKMAFTSAFLMVLVGIGLEFEQSFIPSRLFSITDMAANSIGVCFGVIWGRLLRSKLSGDFSVVTR